MYQDRVARGRPIQRRPSRTRGDGPPTARAIDAVRVEVARGRPLVVAVSGGRDSMVLMEAMARTAAEHVATVATFDHGTGAAATLAASHVSERAQALGLPVRAGLTHEPARSEAGWRAQRMAFLSEIARELDARIVTAHTLDDHLETVVMRAMRGSGARGIAGLLAHSTVGRPFVRLSRAAVAECARLWNVPFVEDPTNLSPRHLRNRVRIDLLPALSRARPSLPAELLDLSRRAAELRAEVDQWIDANLVLDRQHGSLAVDRADLVPLGASALAFLWPALAARHGVTLDRRGTERLVSFTIQGASGTRIQLSGGLEAIRHRGRLVVRQVSGLADSLAPLRDGMTWGNWRFVATARIGGRWTAELNSDEPLAVRAWRPGDRMIPEGSTTLRRLKGLFRDAGVDAGRRREWPVVVAGEKVLWVPGVRRAPAAAARSGRPNVMFRCEHIYR